MPFKFGQRSLERLQGVHPDLVRVAEEAIARSTVDFSITEGLRSVERQAELVRAGASETMNSRHITGHAIDVVAFVGRERRGDAGLYYPIAEAFSAAAHDLKVALRWGGCWTRIDTRRGDPAEWVAQYVAVRRAARKKVFIDMPHFELAREVYP